MADTQADLSGDDREKRIAELKAKMQASAKKAKPAESSEKAAAPTAGAAPVAAPAAVATPVVEVDAAPAPVVAPKSSAVNGAASNGAAVAVAAAEPIFVEDSPEVKARKQMNRREFMTYAWGGALAILALESVAGLFFFMMPRFKAGEFGGVFFIGPESSLPPTDAPPQAFPAGKFWLVNTVDQGPKALYMVCTHLGCLYKWEQGNNRFECPCHGSKFSRDGYYIEGPAPRSLDTFLVAIENGEVAVDTGKKELGAPAADSPDRVVPA